MNLKLIAAHLRQRAAAFDQLAAGDQGPFAGADVEETAEMWLREIAQWAEEAR